MIVAESDLVLTLPRRLAQRFAAMAPLVVHEPPVALSGFDFHQMWHERRQRDPAHAFFRGLVADVARMVTERG